MNKQTVREAQSVVFIVFHLFMATYAVILIAGGATLIYAQTVRDYRLEGLERRVADIDSLHLDERLVRIETTLDGMKKEVEDHSWLSSAANGGVGLLLLRAVVLAVRKRSIE